MEQDGNLQISENKGDQEFEKSISQNIIDHQVYRN